MPQAQSHRRSRSRSPGPSQRPRRDYVVASFPAVSSNSTVSHSRPSARSGVLRQPADATANTLPPSVAGSYVNPQISTGTPLLVSRPHIPPSVGGSSFAQITTAPRSVAQPSAHLPYLTTRPDSIQFQQSLHKNAGMFNQARDFTVMGTFVDGNVTYNDAFPTPFMEKLLGEIIRGAEFDSSARDPPPRCQPGTRLTVLSRCLSFISNCNGVEKMRWVVGAAGVGKSAIMQSVAESPDLPVGFPASVFFSINGRDDASKAIITISYQLATKSDTYRQVIEHEINRDPSLFRSSIAKQFNKLIVEPFIHNCRLNSAGRVLIIIDGLDECKDHRTQQELLRLISNLCLTYPSSPLVWLIASRPEPHITSFFSRPNVIPAYEKEEIPVDSDEARADVERFLRVKFMEIKEEHSLDARWPEERDIWTVADAAGGLFAYAWTVIRYVGDSRIGSPVSQLSDVLYVIGNHPMTGVSREEHPMALLDALYERILSNVPPRIMICTRKLLLALASGWGVGSHIGSYAGGIQTNFIVLCNWLGMTADEAYAAVHHLRSVLYVPQRDKAHAANLEAFHKSFIDYLADKTRSLLFPNFLSEARQIQTECALRILNEVPNGIELNPWEVRLNGIQLNHWDSAFDAGILASGSVTRDKIPLTWLVDVTGDWDHNTITRFCVYRVAIDAVVHGIEREDPTSRSSSCIRFLTTAWYSYPHEFPYNKLSNVVFDQTRRLEFMERGILKEIPLRRIPLHELGLCRNIKLQFSCLGRPVTKSRDPWNSCCGHERIVKREAGKVCGWTTTFGAGDDQSANHDLETKCLICYERLQHQLENRKTHSPNDTASYVHFNWRVLSTDSARLSGGKDGVDILVLVWYLTGCL